MAKQEPVPPPLSDPLNPDVLSQPSPTGKSAKKAQQTKIILVVVVVVAIILLILVIYFAARASSNQQKLDAQYQSGAKVGAEQQRQADLKEFNSQQTKDVRVYKSAEEFGSFELSLPKSWSWVITPNESSGLFVGSASPNYVDTTQKTQPFTLNISKDSYDKLKAGLDSEAKSSKGAIQSSEVTVSGIKSMKYTGPKDNKTGLTPIKVIVPVREKTFIFTTNDASTYGETFTEIINNVKLNP